MSCSFIIAIDSHTCIRIFASLHIGTCTIQRSIQSRPAPTAWFTHPTDVNMVECFLDQFVPNADDIHRHNPRLGPNKEDCIDPWTKFFKKIKASLPPQNVLADILVQLYALWKDGGEVCDGIGQDGSDGIDGQLHVNDIVMVLVLFRRLRHKSILHIGCGGGHEARCFARGNDMRMICIEVSLKASFAAMNVLYSDPICRRQCSVFPIDLLDLLSLAKPLAGAFAPDALYSHSKGMPEYLQASILLIALNNPSIRYVFLSAAINKASKYRIFYELGLKRMARGFIPLHLSSGEETNMCAYKVLKRGRLKVSREQEERLNQMFFHNEGWNLVVSRMDKKRDHILLCPLINSDDGYSSSNAGPPSSKVQEVNVSDQAHDAVGDPTGDDRDGNILDVRSQHVQQFLTLLELPGTMGYDAVTAFNSKMQHDLGQTLARQRRSLVPRSIGGHFANETAEIIRGNEYEQRFNDACGDASDTSDNENEVLSMFEEDWDSDDGEDSDCCSDGFE